MKPWGRWHANDMYRAGGVALVARELKKAGLLHEDARTVDGRTLGEIADAAVETEGQTVIVPIETPLKARGGVAVLYGNLAPGGLRGQARRSRPHAPSRPGARLRLGGGDVRGRQGGQGRRGRRRRDPLRGPARRPRDARDAPRHRRDRRRGPLGVGRARSPTAASPGATHGFMVGHVAPEASKGGPLAALREGDIVVIDVERHELERRARATPRSPSASPTGSSPSPATAAACSRTTRRSSRRPRRAR